MLRFVLDPEHNLLPDICEKLPGRGVWIESDRQSLEQAIKTGKFARSFKCQVRSSSDLPDTVAKLLEKRLYETISLSRRAGILETGFEQVRTALKSKEKGVLVLAADAGSEKTRLLRLLGTRHYIAGVHRGRLGKALGRDSCVYGYVRPGNLAGQLLVSAKKINGFINNISVGRLVDPAEEAGILGEVETQFVFASKTTLEKASQK